MYIYIYMYTAQHTLYLGEGQVSSGPDNEVPLLKMTQCMCRRRRRQGMIFRRNVVYADIERSVQQRMYNLAPTAIIS